MKESAIVRVEKMERKGLCKWEDKAKGLGRVREEKMEIERGKELKGE